MVEFDQLISGQAIMLSYTILATVKLWDAAMKNNQWRSVKS